MTKEQATQLKKIELIEKQLYLSYQKEYLVKNIMIWVSIFFCIGGFVYLTDFGYRDFTGLWFISAVSNGVTFSVLILILFTILEKYLEISCNCNFYKYIKVIWPHKNIILNNNLVVPQFIEEILRENNNNINIYKYEKITNDHFRGIVNNILLSYQELKLDIYPQSMALYINTLYYIHNKIFNYTYVIVVVFIFGITYINNQEYGFLVEEPITSDQNEEVLIMLKHNSTGSFKALVKYAYRDNLRSPKYISQPEFDEIKLEYNKEDNEEMSITTDKIQTLIKK